MTLQISNVAVSAISETSALVTWDTNLAANSRVEYGLTVAYGSTTLADIARVTKHSVSISGLDPGTLYHFRARSGSVHTGPDMTFTTLSPPAPVQVIPPGLFAALDGLPTNDGTVGRPFDVMTAMAHPAALLPDMTLWLREGFYYNPAPPVIPGKQAKEGGYKPKFQGQPNHFITLRAYPGERVQLDSAMVRGSALDTMSRYTIYRDLEILNTDPRRETDVPGSAGPDSSWRKDGVTVHSGPQNHFINCVIHDCGTAIGFWDQAMDSMIYGLITFNNGWVGPDRGHGHGIYIQNSSGVKLIRHVLSWDNFATAMKAYATNAQAVGVHFQGIIAFENGQPESLVNPAWSTFRNEGTLSGTEQFPQRDISLEDSLYYARAGTVGGGLRLGIGSIGSDVTLLRSIIASGNCVAFTNWDMVTMLDCELFVRGLACNVQIAGSQDPGRYVIDRNKWHDQSPISQGARRPFNLEGVKNVAGGGKLSHAEWKAKYGWDANGSYDALPFRGVRTVVHPNEWRDKWDRKAGHVGVLSFDNLATVPVDVSSVLKLGDKWRLQSVEDFFGQPVATGTYDGMPIDVPMMGGKVVGPVGFSKAVQSAGPECFGGAIYVD